MRNLINMKRCFTLALLASSCVSGPVLSVTEQDYGCLTTGESAHKYILTNENGASVMLTDYGARIISIFMPDRNGTMDDVIVGPDNLKTFEEARPERFLGCVIGRYGNRINHA